MQSLVTTSDYLPALDGFADQVPRRRPVLVLQQWLRRPGVDRRTGVRQPFHDLVAERVFAKAGMADTGFLRSDELPGRAALGYLDDGRTNVFHLPVRGNGDGGAYTTVADLRAFWAALFAGRIVGKEWTALMLAVRSEVADRPTRYGLGFWRYDTGPVVFLEGCDHGASFRSLHDPDREVTATVIANTTDGAWPVERQLVSLIRSGALC